MWFAKSLLKCLPNYHLTPVSYFLKALKKTCWVKKYYFHINLYAPWTPHAHIHNATSSNDDFFECYISWLRSLFENQVYLSLSIQYSTRGHSTQLYLSEKNSYYQVRKTQILVSHLIPVIIRIQCFFPLLQFNLTIKMEASSSSYYFYIFWLLIQYIFWSVRLCTYFLKFVFCASCNVDWIGCQEEIHLFHYSRSFFGSWSSSPSFVSLYLNFFFCSSTHCGYLPPALLERELEQKATTFVMHTIIYILFDNIMHSLMKQKNSIMIRKSFE